MPPRFRDEHADTNPSTRASRRERSANRIRANYPDAPPTFNPLPPLHPRTAAQLALIRTMGQLRVVLASGPAGTGKTFLLLAHAIDLLQRGQVDRIICLRPTVEVGQRLGFLPGDMQAKIEPFFVPIVQCIVARMGPNLGPRWIKVAQAAGQLVFTSIQHLRGQTLERCVVLADEAQNCSYIELKLILTRMGPGSLMYFAGDPDQSDLPGEASGWREFVARLAPVPLVGVGRFSGEDVVRDPLLAKLLPFL